jgi:hypothetical protein
MVGNALAADTLSGTGIVGAVTSLKVFFLLAFHSQPSPSNLFTWPVTLKYTIGWLKGTSTFPLTNRPICKTLLAIMFKI